MTTSANNGFNWLCSKMEIDKDICKLLADFHYQMISDGELTLSRLLRKKLFERVLGKDPVDVTKELYPPPVKLPMRK